VTQMAIVGLVIVRKVMSVETGLLYTRWDEIQRLPH
jgi:hypothetical protein